MASIGLTQELEDLFSSVAGDLGWSNTKDVLKGLELEISDNETKCHKKLTRKTKGGKKKSKNTKLVNNKNEKSRRKKKSGESDSSQQTDQGEGENHVCDIDNDTCLKSDKALAYRTKVSTLPDRYLRTSSVITIDSDDDDDAQGFVHQTNGKTNSSGRCDTGLVDDKSDTDVCSVDPEINIPLTTQEIADTADEHGDIDSDLDDPLTTDAPSGSPDAATEPEATSNSDSQSLTDVCQDDIIDTRCSSTPVLSSNELDQEEDITGDVGNFVAANVELSATDDDEDHVAEFESGTSQDVADIVAEDKDVAGFISGTSQDDADIVAEDKEASSDNSSEEDSSNKEHQSDNDSKTKHPSPCLTLTERLIRNRKRMKEKSHVHTDRQSKPSQHDRSVRRKEKNGSQAVEANESNEDVWSSFTNREDISHGTAQSSFHSYRDNETPSRRYDSDSSSDDDDNFEAFLSSIKSSNGSSHSADKTPPSQEEMDDFIDDEPIEISSGSEEEKEEADEIFYYQCDNAERFTDEDQPADKENHINSTEQTSILSDNTINSTNDNFATPAWQPNTSGKKTFKKPGSSNKPTPSVISVLSDSDSDDGFATPSWRPTTTKKTKKNVKTTTKSVIKPSPINVYSEGEDSVFATPVVRPPLKTKKPSNTLPSKTKRPTESNYLKTQGPGKQSTPSFLASLATPVKGASSGSPYVTDFKKKKEELTARLFKLYNKTVFDNKLPPDMKITWNKRLRKTAGYCYYSKSKTGTNRHARIELSEKVCDSAERLRDTLVHELCHAAAWLINGVHDGHGRYWKYWAAKSNVAHPEIPVIKRCHSYEINTKYKYQCTRCQTTIGRHSKSINTDKMCCAYCQGQIILLPPINKDGTPAKTRPPNKFAMFVKENYASAKKGNAQMKHADIMRVLSRDFAHKAKVTE